MSGGGGGAMSGGMHGRRGPGAPLGERASAGAGPQPASTTPCWIEADGPVPGVVLAWRRAPSGGWEALVASWLPAAMLAPRPAGADDGAGAG